MPQVGRRVLVYLCWHHACHRLHPVPGKVVRSDPGPPHATRIELEGGREVEAGDVYYSVEPEPVTPLA